MIKNSRIRRGNQKRVTGWGFDGKKNDVKGRKTQGVIRNELVEANNKNNKKGEKRRKRGGG